MLLYFRGPAGKEFRGWCDQPNAGENHVIYYACEWDQPPQASTDQPINSVGNNSVSVDANNMTGLKRSASLPDPFQPNTVWTGERSKFTVISRKGKTFEARFETDEWERIVKGTINGNVVLWLAKNVQVVKGGTGGDNTGTSSKDVAGDRIDFEWSQSNGKSGTFTLRFTP